MSQRIGLGLTPKGRKLTNIGLKCGEEANVRGPKPVWLTPESTSSQHAEPRVPIFVKLRAKRARFRANDLGSGLRAGHARLLDRPRRRVLTPPSAHPIHLCAEEQRDVLHRCAFQFHNLLPHDLQQLSLGDDPRQFLRVSAVGPPTGWSTVRSSGTRAPTGGADNHAAWVV